MAVSNIGVQLLGQELARTLGWKLCREVEKHASPLSGHRNDVCAARRNLA